MKNFDELSEKEILALAISLEEDDERIYADFVEGFPQELPALAGIRVVPGGPIVFVSGVAIGSW